jgi:hypothetical protein
MGINVDPLDIGLAIAIAIGVVVCSGSVVLCVFLTNRRRSRPRDDSTDSLV